MIVSYPVLLIMQSYLDFGYIIVLFVFIIFGAYYVSRYAGRFNMKKNSKSNIKIISAISVGPQKTLQLVKVGKEVILIGVSKDKITFIKDISLDSLDLQFEENMEITPFNKHYKKLLSKRNNNSQSIDNGEGNNEK